ncbi:MAG: dienelactone hydrolase family protein [Bacteroidetes bacterium]|nr:MAG: dienelactone hydrolase family protein [Bacteroidota bacterium]
MSLRILLIFLIVIQFFNRAEGQTKSCCTSPNSKFSELAMGHDFGTFHLPPDKINLVDDEGEPITFKCEDGTNANAYQIKSKNKSSRWLLVFHEWWGLNDYIRQEAMSLAAEMPEMNLLAIDLYDGKIAETASIAQKFLSELDENRASAIIKGALHYAGSEAQIYTIGWCMGGTWSLQAGILAGKQAKACVMYYGMPESDVSKLKMLNCEVLGIFASRDSWISKEVVDEFAMNMKKAGKKLQIKVFEADHAFANPSNPR